MTLVCIKAVATIASAIALAHGVLVPAVAAAGRSGDRQVDPVITYPSSFLLQNGGPVIDVKNPPEAWMHKAIGDGKADDTTAFRDAYDLLKRDFKAHGPWNGDHYYIYVPNGTYRVTDTLIYRGATVGAYPKWDGTFDINCIRIVGQSRKSTVIRLADHCPGYQNPDAPKIVVAFQHPDTIFNNLPGGNWLRNITISTGSGNPGAVGVFMQGANQTDMHSVTVRSEDGQGQYGIWFKTGSIQGYYCDVSVKGFNYGIFDPANGESDTSWEYMTLTGQNKAGILHTGGGMSLRRVLIDESQTGAGAIKIDEGGSQTVVIDSVFKSKAGANRQVAAIEATQDQKQGLFVRGLATSGYSCAIRQAGRNVVPEAVVKEYVSSNGIAANAEKSLELPVQDTPQVAWYDPRKDWAVVDDYPSVQAAFDSGKPVVCFRKRTYKLSGDINVPATVKFVNVMASDVSGGKLVVSVASHDPLLVQDSGLPIEVHALRDVALRCAGGGLSNPQGLPVTFYLENVNDVATGDNFCRPGQHIYARQIDIEYGQGNQIVCNGGALWIFGFKTENMGATPFTVKQGGSLEVLGGYTNTTNQQPEGKQNPELHMVDGRASISLFTNMGAPSEAVVDGPQPVRRSDLALRGGSYDRDIQIPLYVDAGAQTSKQAAVP